MKSSTKREEIVKQTPTIGLVTVRLVTEQINPTSLTFGQEDLNKLVEKLNEVIAVVNKLVI